jgi:hypothetical protein
MSSGDIPARAELLKETAERHHPYEQSGPEHDWSDWYAAYMTAREQGSTPDEAAEAAARYVEGA